MEDALHLEVKALEQSTILPVPVEALPKHAKEKTISTSNARRTRGVNAQSAWASLIPGTNKKSAAINEKKIDGNATIMPKEAQIVVPPALAPQNELDDNKLTKVHR